MDRCAECGFEYDLSTAADAGPAIVAGADALAEVLVAPGADVGTRRHEGVWSPLEYACHLRDALLVLRERVLLARREPRPSLTPMGRDERVDHDGYADQDPSDVARQLRDAAALFANVLARLGPDDWDRTVLYNYPTPADRSLRWVAVHAVHEVRHHGLDVERQLRLAPLAAFHHLAISVRDRDASAAWYADVLGFEELFREEGDERRAVVMRFAGGGHSVGLVEHRPSSPEPFDARRTGLDHAAFTVPSLDALRRWAAHLTASGVEHSGVVDIPPGAILNFKDPDGVALALFWDREASRPTS